MMSSIRYNGSPLPVGKRGELMREPEEVAAMLALQAKGWGAKRIARELGVSRNTVKRYLAAGGWVAYRSPERASQLAGLEAWLKERFRRHRGNAEVIRQELLAEKRVKVSLRTVERAVAPWRRELAADARATVRFETAPGEQLQIDFGEKRVVMGGEAVRVHLFVATLGYSRRNFVMAFDNERQGSWLRGIEAAFAHFGGVPAQVLLDNARALVEHHDVETREVRYNERFHAFCRYWGITPKACAPYRARTKGKDENGVGYVKGNALAGREFASWDALHGHLAWWMREVADVRIHGTTGEPPIERFRAAEAAALKPLAGKPPFVQERELRRRVHSDACVEVDTNRYSVPWKWIGHQVRVRVAEQQVRIYHREQELAVHAQSVGRRQRSIQLAHLEGIVGAWPERQASPAPSPETAPPPPPGELQRPLSDYEALLGGGWQ
jgi:transposase